MQSRIAATTPKNPTELGFGSARLGPPVARGQPLLLPDTAAAAAPAPSPKQPRCAAAGDGDAKPRDAAGGFPWLAAFGFAYLTLSSLMAVRRSWPDRGAAAFVAFAYADLVLLFWCLRRYERADPGSRRREWLRRAVWLLTSALTLVFSAKVAAVMPAAGAAAVYAMAAATVCGGFVAFFCVDRKTAAAAAM